MDKSHCGQGSIVGPQNGRYDVMCDDGRGYASQGVAPFSNLLKGQIWNTSFIQIRGVQPAAPESLACGLEMSGETLGCRANTADAEAYTDKQGKLTSVGTLEMPCKHGSQHRQDQQIHVCRDAGDTVQAQQLWQTALTSQANACLEGCWGCKVCSNTGSRKCRGAR